MRDKNDPKIHIKLGLDRNSAIVYTKNPRLMLNRNDIDHLYRQIDQVRRELNIPERRRKESMDDFFVQDWK